MTVIVKNSNKKMWIYSGYGKGEFRDLVIFGVHNSKSSHTDNLKNNFLILGEGSNFGINESFGSPEKMFCIKFKKAKTKYCFSLHYNGDNSYLFVNGKKIFKFKANNDNLSFPIQFCLVGISEYL